MVPSAVLEVRAAIEKAFYPGRIVPAHTEYEHYYKDTEDGAVYASVTTKTSLLSRKYYKQLAADKAVDHIQSKLMMMPSMSPEEITAVFSEARDMHVTDLNLAGLWGTHGHNTIDEYVKTWIDIGERPLISIRNFCAPDVTPQGICAALSAEKFFNDHDLFPVVSEKKIVSKKYRYGGTLDSLWFIGDVYKGREGDRNCAHDWWEKGKNKLSCAKCAREITLVLLLGDWKTSNQIFGRGEMGKYDYAMQVAAYDGALREMCGVRPKRHWIIRLDKAHPHYEVGVIPEIKRAYKCFLGINMISEFARASDPVMPLNKKTVITL